MVPTARNKQSGSAAAEPTPAGDGSDERADTHLQSLLALLHTYVALVVEHRRESDPDPDRPLRGLYIDEAEVDRLLAGGWLAHPAHPPALVLARERLEAVFAGAPSRVNALVERFGLDRQDLDLLVIALAPDVDARFERFYGYLNDDVSRRRVSVGVALELLGAPAGDYRARARLDASSPLRKSGLLVVEDGERPVLTRSLRVADRVAAYLLGDDATPVEIEALVDADSGELDLDVGPLVRALGDGARLIYLRERPGSAGRALGVAALRAFGLGALSLNLTHLDLAAKLEDLAALVEREARLTNSGVVIGPLDALGDAQAERARTGARLLAGLDAPVVLLGRESWDPRNAREIPLVLDAPTLSPAQVRGLWTRGLGDAPVEDALVDEATADLELSPEQVVQATEAAQLLAAYDGDVVTPHHLRAGALAQNAAGLERFARRIQPAVAWDDLVLPAETATLLRELVARVRRRQIVLDEWGMRAGGGRGRGVTALFAGESGTGKTMSAEVIAGVLGLELYAINLATVVDKYIGETEKNLERIFSEVSGVNGVLLFDEADALFGKRSEVRDAHDRYANVEVAYLLQRIESFDGLAILATNLRANLDEAFTRRLDAVVDFPFPDVEQRAVIWEHALRPDLPRKDDVDIAFLAEAFELSGGNISSIALTAAYLAADEDRPVAMADLVRAVHREYRKLGRLTVASEFGVWYSAIDGDETPLDR
jgi:hypothetical protein